MTGGTRPVVRIATPDPASHGAGFSALRINAGMFGPEGSPWFNIDHFRMRTPTFPPHPHAGFSAITYVLPHSANGMRNRDSRGDRSLIGPGGVHWTAASGGVVHEEIPDRPGIVCEGLQIFVRQPPEQEKDAPRIAHADAADIPTLVQADGTTIHLLAGAMGGTVSPIAPPSPLTMADILLPAGARFAWTPPSGWSCTVYLYSGTVTVNGRTADAPGLVCLSRSDGMIGIGGIAEESRLLLMSGLPIDAPGYSNGPFLLSSPAAITDAVQRYRAGEMGSLPPEW